MVTSVPWQLHSSDRLRTRPEQYAASVVRGPRGSDDGKSR
jgi:hypothetical protein